SLILGLSLCAFGGSAYLAMKHSIRGSINSALRERLEGVQKIIDEDGPRGPAALEDELREYADGMGNMQRLRVEDSSGVVYFASRGLENPLANPESNDPSRPFRAKIDASDYEVILHSSVVEGKQYGVTLATSRRDYNWAIARFRLILFALVPALLVVASLGGYWMSHR